MEIAPPLFGIKNDRATVVAPCRPWEFQAQVPAVADKAAYLRWRGDASTSHLLFTGAQGTNSDLRCNKKTNPVRKLHALVADYDVPITEAMEENILKVAPIDLQPSWIYATFSGHRRLVWVFESAIGFEDLLAKRFLEIAGRELKVASLLPALDQPAWLNVYQVFDVGVSWRKLSDNLLPTTVLNLWLYEAAKKTDWSKVGELSIPLTDVEAEVHKQFPNAWSGEFSVGSRGTVFWEGRSNPTSAIVTDSGMVAFSTDRLFHSWGSILGAAFIRKYQADKLGAAVDGVHFDGFKYYRKTKDAWVAWAKEDFVKHLCANKGLDSSKGKGETASETTRAEVFIQENRRVDGLIPRLFDPRDLIYYGGKTYLNCARVKAVQPAEERQEWGVNFPWCAQFLQMRFDDHERNVQFAWWKRFYCSALAGDLLKGQTLFLVGKVRLGKTLYSHKMVGASVGGAGDASAHISKGSEFNKELFEIALRTIDDGDVASDPASHRKFSEAIKRQAANPTMVYRAMYRDAQSITYNGRIIVTLNDDAYSLQMIPDLELSMEEKIIVLKFRDTPYSFGTNHQVETLIESELPYLLRWLVDWQVPEDIVGDNRLGVKEYINEELRAGAMHAGQGGDLLELIAMWIKRGALDETAGLVDGCWQGTATAWYALVSSDEVMRPLITKLSPRMLGKRFSEIARIRDSGVSVVDADKKRGNIYRICVAPVERKTVRYEAASE